jgi:hypothetical protein
MSLPFWRDITSHSFVSLAFDHATCDVSDVVMLGEEAETHWWWVDKVTTIERQSDEDCKVIFDIGHCWR